MRGLVGHGAMLVMLASGLAAQDNGPSYTLFGTPGLLEMPTAESANPDDIAATVARSPSGGTRTSFTYQITPRVSGSFRYGNFNQYSRPNLLGGRTTYETFDRSFDLQYRLTDESGYAPAIAVGLRDFLGTGRFSSEYVVASKSFGSQIVGSVGLGWGKMGQQNEFKNPLSVIDDYFTTRPEFIDREFGTGPNQGNGGTISANQFFRGPAAVFAGVEYQYSDTLGFKAEYSSINYPVQTFRPAINYNSPLNFGVSYRYRPNI